MIIEKKTNYNKLGSIIDENFYYYDIDKNKISNSKVGEWNITYWK